MVENSLQLLPSTLCVRGIELLSSGLTGNAFIQLSICSHLLLGKACFPHDRLDAVFSVWETAEKMLESFFLSCFRW